MKKISKLQLLIHIYVTVCFGLGYAMNLWIMPKLGMQDSWWFSGATHDTWLPWINVLILNVMVWAMFHTNILAWYERGLRMLGDYFFGEK